MSSIQTVAKNSTIRIYYKSHDLSSGLDIVFNVWDDLGTQLVTNQAATGEIGSRGLYYFDYLTPNSNTHLLVKASLPNSTFATPAVYKVGTPSQRLYFVDPKFQTSQTWAYKIYDLSGSILKSGNLNELTSSGFYYTSTSGVTSSLPVFFSVGNELANTFNLVQGAFEYEGDGQITIGGLSSVALKYTYVPDGGVVVGGSGIANNDQSYIGSGTIFIGGEGVVGLTLRWPSLGGVTVDGHAPFTIDYTGIAGGTVSVDGQAAFTIDYSTDAVGGVAVNGQSPFAIDYSYVSDSGVSIGGSAFATTRLSYVSTGQANIGGHAPFTVNYESVPGGTVTIDGHAPFTIDYNTTSNGGVEIGGEVTAGVRYSWTSEGGISVGGESYTELTLSHTPEGQTTIGGHASFTVSYVYEGTGVVIVGGRGLTGNEISYVGDGTVTVGGHAPFTIAYSAFPEDGVSISGSAAARLKFSHVPEGQIEIGGHAPFTVSYVYEGTGVVIVGGIADTQVRLSYTSSGGLRIAGDAEESLTLAWQGTGGIALSGAAEAKITKWRFVGSGTIIVSGISTAKSVGRPFRIRFKVGQAGHYGKFMGRRKIKSILYFQKSEFYVLNDGAVFSTDTHNSRELWDVSWHLHNRRKEVFAWWERMSNLMNLMSSIIPIPKSTGQEMELSIDLESNASIMEALEKAEKEMQKIVQVSISAQSTEALNNIKILQSSSSYPNLEKILNQTSKTLDKLDATIPQTSSQGRNVVIRSKAKSIRSTRNLNRINSKLAELENVVPEKASTGKLVRV